MITSGITLLTLLFSLVTPQKMWFTPSQPLIVQSTKDVTLELTDFSGAPIAAKGSADLSASQSVDLKSIFAQTAQPGTYLLYALPRGTTAIAGVPKNFLGTPLVIEVLAQSTNPLNTMVTHVLPLQYAVMTTSKGPITEVFYYDAAPHTVDNFLTLSMQGYYDGIVFHRVIQDFVIQGGDPLGNDPDKTMRGTGSPGYSITDEFNDYPHIEGVLSMANSGSPNSAGSQFFICLDYTRTQHLDHKYTAFGKAVDGMDAVKQIAQGQVDGDAPVHPETIEKVEVFPVTAEKDPYTAIITGKGG